ncbi:MAG: PQQ-binding-like beta-propeller repeat protein, partial [Candidatus Bathyarchaeota archaeon]|nr:PQQ-binding-like beta-propeller repeat protein [Candidatus Bathyarchaeota archaeon]
MRTSKTKTTTLIAVFLTLSIAASLVTWLPTANAAVNRYNSYVYIALTRETIGVNQPLVIVMWTADVPPDIGEQTGQVAGGRQAWYNIVINVTKPDGTTQSFTIDKTDPVGGGYITFTPDSVGTHYAQCFFPATWKNTTTTQNFYTAAASAKVYFTVTEEQVQAWAESPLPDGYWTRPINNANRDWYVLAGNWLGGAHEQPAGAAGGVSTRLIGGKGAESAHVLWAKPYYLGGLMEERFGETGYQTGHYQGMSWSAIIINGKIYYSPRSDAHGTQGILCVDLYTGETLSFINATMPSFGQIYNYDSGNQHGGYAYLWRTSGVTLPEVVQVPRVKPNADVRQLPVRIAAVQTINRTATPISTGTVWEMIDAYTFKTVCYIANVTSGGTAVYGKDGSILRYNVVNLGTTANPNYYLQVWNSSHGTMVSSQLGTGAWQWRPSGGTFGGTDAYLGGLAYNYVHDGNVFFSLNVSIPSILGPRNSILNQTGSIQAVREGEYVIIGTAGQNNELGIAPGWMMAVSLKRGQEGAKLWDLTFTPPSSANNATMSLVGVYPDDDVIVYSSTKLLKRYGISLSTGQKLWESEPEPDMNYYSTQINYYNGLLLTTGYGGRVIAYDIKTGKIQWTYNATNVGFESPYGNYPINIFGLADGKIYTLTGEHSITQPMWRGPNIRCINASNG